MFLYQEGPYTKGIFRRSAGAKACRELRDRLDSGTEEPEITHQSVFVIAAVLKVTPSPSFFLSRPFETRQQRAGVTEVCPEPPWSPDWVICLQAGSQSHTQGAALFRPNRHYSVRHPGRSSGVYPRLFFFLPKCSQLVKSLFFFYPSTNFHVFKENNSNMPTHYSQQFYEQMCNDTC